MLAHYLWWLPPEDELDDDELCELDELDELCDGVDGGEYECDGTECDGGEYVGGRDVGCDGWCHVGVLGCVGCRHVCVGCVGWRQVCAGCRGCCCVG
jgi:hypothetical protein